MPCLSNCATPKVPGAEEDNGESLLTLKKLELENIDLDKRKRESWSGKLDFVMAALSLSVGMGNLWRFPYLCYRNGGGAFLIPYVLLASVLGFPLLFMEYSLGQYGRGGIVSIWKVCPIFQGIGWAMFTLSAATSVYYIMLISWCLYYIYASFAKTVPWQDCGNAWNTADCLSFDDMICAKDCAQKNGTWFNNTCFTEMTLGPAVYRQVAHNVSIYKNNSEVKASSDEFFHHHVLRISEGFENLGPPVWHLVICLLICWVIVFVCLARGVKSSGKATYVTALFPYVVMVILFVRGVMLEGAAEGISYFFTPQWHVLGSPKVWADAACQVFFSLSCGWGGQITLASYNKFKNNALRDTVFVVIGDSLTSIFAGVVTFSFIGYMARVLDVPVDNVATKGAGLAFIVYPQAVTTLPITQLWAVLFMLMFITVGIGSQFGIVQTVQTTLESTFPDRFQGGRRPLKLLIFICLLFFLLGIPCTTRGGMYVLQLLDMYCATFGAIIIALFICIALSWVYGSGRFMDDIAHMLDKRPSPFFHVWWRFICPALILFILIFTLVDYERTSYGDYKFPLGYDIIGWCIVVIEILCVPVTIVYKLATCEKELSLLGRFRHLCQPLPSWKPPREFIVADENTKSLVNINPLSDT